MSITRLSVGPRIAGAVVHGDTVYLAGQVAADASAGVKGQTEQILKKFDELLAAGARARPSCFPSRCGSRTWAATTR